MASSKAMTSKSPANQELPRQSSSLHLLAHIHSKNFTSINMDDLLHNIYSDSNHFPSDQTVGESSAAADQPPITLEDFLAKAGAITEEDVKAVVESEQAVFPAPAAADDMMNGGGVIAYSDAAAQGFDRRIAVRGKRRAVEVVDKKTQQKQRRMIKNRESAARSRERKQAYTAELESMVMQLEEENARLLREEAEQTKKRFKQLMEDLIPVVEKKRPPRVLRRVLSM